MPRNAERVFFPLDVAEAVSLLSRHAPYARVIAGGTLLGRLDAPKVKALVDIGRLPLDYVKAGPGGLRIGARTTFETLAGSPLVGKWAGGLLAQAAQGVTSQLIRNAGTVGGNVVQAMPYNDLPPALLTLDAEALVAEGRGRRRLPLARLLHGHPSRSLGRSALLVEIRLPPGTRSLSGACQRFARTRSDWEALVQVAVALRRKDGRAADARIALGGIVPTTKRFPEAERALKNGSFSPRLAEEAARKVWELLPGGGRRGEYRRELAAVLVRRAIIEAWERA